MLPLWTVRGAVFFFALIMASCHDIRTRYVPDGYTIFLILLALSTSPCRNWWGIFCGVPFLLAAVWFGGIGGADIKIMSAAGMIVGFVPGIFAMIIALSSMLLFYQINRWICRKKLLGQAYPLVPFLTGGILIIYLMQMP